jgi:hypothetical protein
MHDLTKIDISITTRAEINVGVSTMKDALAPGDRDGSKESRCKSCGSHLTFHQPDQRLPDRLLATCERCKAWYLTDPRMAGFALICSPED